MTAPTHRPKPGQLEYRCPNCPMCGKETDTDGDSFRCYDCRCSWSMTGSDDGSWDDPNEPICPKVITYEAHPLTLLNGRCLLGESHRGDHFNGTQTWSGESLKFRQDVTESEVDW